MQIYSQHKDTTVIYN